MAELGKMVRVDKNIYQRGPHSFLVRKMLNGHQVSETFDTLAEARAYRDMKNVARAVDPDAHKILAARVKKRDAAQFTLAEALKRYAKEITANKKSPYSEECRINKLLRIDIATQSFYAISADDIVELLDKLREDGIGESTARKYAAVLSHCYTIALKRWRMQVKNPVTEIERPANSKPRKRRLEDNEDNYMIDALGKSRNPYILPLYQLAIETAMRQGELLALQWHDVDLDPNGSVATLHETKNGEARAVPLSLRAVDILNSLKKLPRGIEGRVFPLERRNIRAAWDAGLKRARKQYESRCKTLDEKPDPRFLSALRFHDLRHEATSRLFELGLDRIEAAAITGHKTLQMLKDYTHLRAKNLARKLG